MRIQKAEAVAAKPVTAEGAKDVQIRLLIHQAEDAPNFYMRQFDIAPGGHTPLHRHAWEHEIYILAGQGAARGEGQERKLSAGDCVFVPPGEEHQFANIGKGVMKMLCLVPRDSG